ncbi:MAG: hypothetical protein KatS3mg091_602 [Patescibacteria group bacterium]|nr:MAG: hypothetical protein KatS3mg091_602 [Patescibacteria group bacterium]
MILIIYFVAVLGFLSGYFLGLSKSYEYRDTYYTGQENNDLFESSGYSNNVIESGLRQESIATPEAGEVTVSPVLTQELSSDSNLLESSIPSSWLSYNGNFGRARFSFRYPLNYSISDVDSASGELFIVDAKTKRIYVGIDTAEYAIFSLRFDSYVSGSRRVWLKNNLGKTYPYSDWLV